MLCTSPRERQEVRARHQVLLLLPGTEGTELGPQQSQTCQTTGLGLLEPRVFQPQNVLTTWEYVTLIYSLLKELCGEHHVMISKGSITLSHPQQFWKLFRWARSSLRGLKLLQPDVLSECSAYSAGSVSKPTSPKSFRWYVICTNTSAGKPNSLPFTICS